MPSAAPTSVEVSGSTPSTITLQWGSVDCRHQNGEIEGYSVRYGEEGSEREETVRIPKATVTLSGLKSSTRHTVSVAAINSIGVGPYTNTVAMTSGKQTVNLPLYIYTCFAVRILLWHSPKIEL